MKLYEQSILFIAIILLGSACERETYEIKSTSSVYVINAAVDNGPIRVNVGAGNGFSYSKATDLAFGTSNIYGAFSGGNKITVVNSLDTTKTVFNRTLNLEGVSTLYIAGQVPITDTIFQAEKNLPYISQGNINNPDNSFYLRFVNLSPNSNPLSINIKQSTVKETTSLGYKSISQFKKYEALTTTANYIFEITDPITNRLLATYTLNTGNNRFKTISLVIKGLVDGTGVNAFGVFVVAYS